MKSILILEDNDERVAGFMAAVAQLGPEWQLRLWRDAPSMLEECAEFFPEAEFISLDHDLNPLPGATRDPGTGLQVAKFLAGYHAICPVLIHSTNTDAAWSMHNELRFARWPVDRLGPLGDDWISRLWLPKVRTMLADTKTNL